MSYLARGYYSGDAVNRTFPVSFPYINAADVAVFVNGLQAAPSSITFVSTSVIQLAAAPAAGTNNVLVTRVTQASAMLHQIQTGTILPADINEDNLQLLYLIQEQDDLRLADQASGASYVTAAAGYAAAAAASAALVAGPVSVFTTTLVAMAANLAGLTYIITQGYNTVGDGGGAVLKGPITGNPGDNFSFLNSISGKYWQVITAQKTPEMIGTAAGDRVTNDTAIITLLESSPYPEFYLGTGKQYKTTLTVLSKRYVGPGSILKANGTGLSGLRSTSLTNSTGHTNILAAPQTTARSLIIMGDSIEDEFGVTYGTGWPSVLRDLLNQRQGVSTCSVLSSINLGHLTAAGGWTGDVSGALGQGLQAGVGATLIFTADDVDYLGIRFRRAAGLGSVQLHRDIGAGYVLLDTISTAGATADTIFQLFAPTISPMKSPKGSIFKLTVTVNSVALNGLHLQNAAQPASTISPMTCAFSGYTTANFANATRLAEIAALDPYANTPMYLAPGLTNDIYNATFFQTVAQSRANLETIIASLGSSLILRINPQPNETTLGYTSRSGEGYEAYREMVYQLAQKYNLRLIDLGEIDLATYGATMYQDGLHPTVTGHKLFAAFVFEKLGLGNTTFKKLRSNLTFAGGAAATGSPYAIPKSILMPNGWVALEGLITITGIAAGTKIGTISAEARPMTQLALCCVQRAGGASAGIDIFPNGDVYLQYKTGAPDYVSLDGQCYVVH